MVQFVLLKLKSAKWNFLSFLGSFCWSLEPCFFSSFAQQILHFRHVGSKVCIALFMGGAKYEGFINVRSKFPPYIHRAFVLCTAHEKSDADLVLHMQRYILHNCPASL